MRDGNDTLTSAGDVTTHRANGQLPLSDRVRSLRLAPASPTARPRGAWLPWGLTAIAFATAAVFGWRAYRLEPIEAATATVPQTSVAERTPPAAPTARAQGTAGTGDVVLDSKGYILAAHQIQISPQVGGEIIWLDPNFQEGAVYKKGDRLAEIDPVISAARLRGAQAAVDVAEVNLRQVETGSTLNEIRMAKSQFATLAARLAQARVDERANRGVGVYAARVDTEKSRLQVVADEAAYKTQEETVARLEVALEEQRHSQKAQLLRARADLEEAEKHLKDCTIRAPTTGIILSKKAELGGYVNPLAFGAAGYLCEMADLRDLEVDLDIQERDISRVRPGQRCRIVPEAGQNDEAFLKGHPDGYAGVVSRRLPVANRSKGAIKVRVKVLIPEDETSTEYLLPDMGVLVSFLKPGP